MKFTHGIWFDRERTRISNAVEIGHTSEPKGGSLKALCTTRHVQHRGDTLNHPTITLEMSTPAEGIIACSAVHFSGAGSTEPRFNLFPKLDNLDAFSPRIDHCEQSGTSTVSSGSLVAVLNKNPSKFGISYRSQKDDKEITNIGYQSLQYIVAPPSYGKSGLPLEASTNIADPYYRAPADRSSKPHMVVSLDLAVGEYVYGLGERFGPSIKNGQEIDMWNEDAGTCTNYAYKNIPFYMTNRGYGVFFDHSDVVSFDIQSERLAKVQVSVPGEQIRWLVIAGPTPKDVLRRYSVITGQSSLPPPWSFGLYLSTSFLTDYDETTVNSQLAGMQSRRIPVSVLHFDCFWMRPHAWTDFTFDPRNFPDPRGFLDRLHERGIKVCVWINPYIAQDSSIFDEAVAKGYLIQRVDGTVWQSDIWQAGMGIVDFTNLEAAAWYRNHLESLLDIGVDTFKTDFGERIPWEDVKFHDGMDPRAGHNFYSLLYNRVVMDSIANKRGVDQAVVFSRAATAGGQTMPVHWGGDCESTWAGMAQSLRGGLSLGLSGFSFWSHDIAGFISEGLTIETPNPAIYKRWVQFGLLSSHSRLHGSHTYRVPWLIDDEACDVLGKFSRLKNRLMPYIFTQAIHCHNNGLPMVRAMLVEFPDDPNCRTLDQQYMFGDCLLVAPVFREDGVCEYYVPAGKWVGILDGKTRIGPAWHTEKFDALNLPVLLREGKAILVGSGERPDYDWPEELETALVGHMAQQHTISIPVPSFKTTGSLDGHVVLTVNEGVVSREATTTGSGKIPQVCVLGPNTHL